MLFGGTAVLRRILAFSVTIALLCVIPAAAIAGVISETVTYPSGAVMPNVMAVAVNEETGLRSTVISDGKGFYGFPAFDVGIYTVTTTAGGFKTFREDKLIYGLPSYNIDHNQQAVIGPVHEYNESPSISCNNCRHLHEPEGAGTRGAILCSTHLASEDATLHSPWRFRRTLL